MMQSPMRAAQDAAADFIIRDYVVPDDYVIHAAIQTAVLRHTPAVAADYADMDAQRDSQCVTRRWIAAVDGQPIGVGTYYQLERAYHPQKFFIRIWILPEYRRRGIGTALYDTIRAALEPFDPVMLWTDSRAYLPDGIRFAEQRGFVEWYRSAESFLFLDQFDPAPFAGLEDKLRAEGITLSTLRELQASDPDCLCKLHALEGVLVLDVPGGDDRTFPDFETWLRLSVQNEVCLPDAWIVAMRGDEHVGMHNMWSDRASDMLYNGLTAVRREYRGRGIATAMKVRAIRWGQANGNSLIKTANAVDNAPMLAVNRRLGFVKQPEHIEFELILRETD
ncbi:MAG: GNAT family N-acetyltransferase [Anaerolineae bacterium]|nr:GNAT family N-acetyltransferase [Anaerolineae bacterium]